MLPPLPLLVAAALAGLVGLIGAFNLEPRVPVVKRGAKGSYFGFSVAEHQESLSNTSNYVSW